VTDDEIEVRLVAIVKGLAEGREPIHLEMHDGDCALCGNTPVERHAPDCPYRMAKELMG
jgi:hypothetical protein